MTLRTIRNITLSVIIYTLLQSCGAAHIQQQMVAADLHQYANAYITSVSVESTEQNGDSLDMNRKMETYAHEQLRSLIANGNYTLLSESDSANQSALAFDLDIDIVYGSRAMRYWVGFGAGKGSVTTNLNVIDSVTGELKFSATGESDLAVGGFGGSMEQVISQNIDELLGQYPPAN